MKPLTSLVWMLILFDITSKIPRVRGTHCGRAFSQSSERILLGVGAFPGPATAVDDDDGVLTCSKRPEESIGRACSQNCSVVMDCAAKDSVSSCSMWKIRGSAVFDPLDHRRRDFCASG